MSREIVGFAFDTFLLRLTTIAMVLLLSSSTLVATAQTPESIPVSQEMDEPQPEVTEPTDPAGDGVSDDPSASDTGPDTPQDDGELLPVENLTATVSTLDCDPAEAVLAMNESASLRCEAAVELSGDLREDDIVTLDWTIEVAFADQVDLRLPESPTSIQPELVSDDGLPNYSLLGNWNYGESLQTLTFDVVTTRTTCQVGELNLSVSITPLIIVNNIAIETHSPASFEGSVVFDVVGAQPVVTLQPVSFGTLRFDGEKWGTAHAASTVTVVHEGCPIITDQEVRFHITSGNQGLVPRVHSVSNGNTALIQTELRHESPESTHIATIPAGFQGRTEFTVELVLSPDPEVVPGDHSFDLSVTVSAAP